MKDCVNAYLVGRGFGVNTKALEVINVCDDWYSNRLITDFHKRANLNGVIIELCRMNFAKRCCSDDANLCEVISIAPEENADSEEFIEDILAKNRFDVRYREQLEKTSATGTTGAYIYLKNANYLQEATGEVRVKGGDIRINYVEADNIIPLTVENDLVTECAFSVTNVVKGKEKTTLVIFTMNEQGRYLAETVMFDEFGGEIKDEYTSIQLGDVKPFSIMHVAEVNNIDNMQGYGLPKIYNTIPLFKALDLCYSLMFGDLEKGDKIVFINELLACIAQDDNGMAMLTPQQKEIFVLLGEKLPDQESIVKEYNPIIRVDDITKVFELVLSLISMSFGYGTKKYTFENGQITTATEYIGEKQDEMQELNKQRKVAEDYITDIIHACEWFSNEFLGTNYNVEEELSIEFDDSYIEDRATHLETMRADALSFPEIPMLKVWYLMDAYNLPEDEAMGLVQDMSVNGEPGEDEDFSDAEIDSMIEDL